MVSRYGQEITPRQKGSQTWICEEIEGRKACLEKVPRFDKIKAESPEGGPGRRGEGKETGSVGCSRAQGRQARRHGATPHRGRGRRAAKEQRFSANLHQTNRCQSRRSGSSGDADLDGAEGGQPGIRPVPQLTGRGFERAELQRCRDQPPLRNSLHAEGNLSRSRLREPAE